MPILTAEPSLFPETLLDDVTDATDALTDGDRHWWAVYTRSRQEKSLARELFAKHVPYYLPLVPKVSLIRGRRVKSLLPLFGSYLFMYASEAERFEALSTQRVAHLFQPPDQTCLRHDLRQVRSLIAAGAPLTIESRLEAGQRVRVKNGSLMGIEGTVVARRGEDRLVVAVEFLQQGVSILISDFQVEPI